MTVDRHIQSVLMSDTRQTKGVDRLQKKTEFPEKVFARLTADLAFRLRALSEETGKGVSRLIREAVKLLLERYGK